MLAGPLDKAGGAGCYRAATKAVGTNAGPARFGTRSACVFCLAIAAGWWALAGSPAAGFDPDRTTAAMAGAAAIDPIDDDTRPPVPPAGRPTSAEPTSAVDRFPYAPGTDDLLPSSETVEPSGSVAIARPMHAASGPDGATAARGAGVVSGWIGVARPGGGPSLLLWLERDRVATGEAVRVHVATALASHCHAQGLLDGDVAPNATLSVIAGEPGVHRLGVTCFGQGVAVTRDVTLHVPLPVYPDSTLNRRLAASAGMPWTRIGELPAAAREALPPGIADGPVTAGDFFQEGRYAILAAGVQAGALATRFLAVDDGGRWTDRSAELLTGSDVDMDCVGPSVALSADFNGDGKPDVWLGCGACGSRSDAAPCRPLLVLSQADGRYRVVRITGAPGVVAAEARDADSDGTVDVLVFDPAAGATALRTILRGRGDGSFAEAAATAASSR